QHVRRPLVSSLTALSSACDADLNPCQDGYDFRCQRFITGDIKTVRRGRKAPLDSGPVCRAGYCNGMGKLFTRRVSRAITWVEFVMDITRNTLVIAAATGLAVTIHPVAAADPAVHPDQWPRVQAALAPDAALESRITALMADMTLEQKVGQVVQPDIASV